MQNAASQNLLASGPQHKKLKVVKTTKGLDLYGKEGRPIVGWRSPFDTNRKLQRELASIGQLRTHRQSTCTRIVHRQDYGVETK